MKPQPKTLNCCFPARKMLATRSSFFTQQIHTFPLFPQHFNSQSKRSTLGHKISQGIICCQIRCNNRFRGAIRAVDGGKNPNSSARYEEEVGEEEGAYEILPNGKKCYLDEQDVVTFLDPPIQLIPLDPASYNPAAYLWKKIGDISEERRHRLLDLLNPKLISRAWEIAGTRYGDPNLMKKSASKLLSGVKYESSLEIWNCRSNGGSVPISWFNSFKKAIFCSNDGNVYGRFIGGSILVKFTNTYYPLYFTVKQHKEVLSTEQPCDLAYEMGDGLLDLQDYPPGFPKAVKHPYPFDDQVVVYIRHVGPGVLVGQAWQEGIALQQIPQKLCNEILMVKKCDA